MEWHSDTPHPVISLIKEQEDVVNLGGTLRLGNWPCDLKEGSVASSLYQQSSILERHRHRYEFNNDYREKLEDCGVVFSGVSPDNTLVEIIEIKDHPFFVGCQFHPEFKSRPNRPHPLFEGFVGASLKYQQAR